MSVFVGRTQELEQLKGRLQKALDGQGGVVFITGDAGAGKSSLVQRFLVEATLAAPEARVISGDCSEQYGAGEPYQPFVEAFRDLVAAGPEKAGGKTRLRDLARELAPHWLAAIPVAGDVIAATAATAVELKQAMGGGGTATAAPPSEEALFFQYTELLLAAAAEHPVLLFLDDLHWADHATVTLLGHVARKAADKPILIIGTYRAADVDVAKHPIRKARLELERYGVAEEIVLTALDTAELAELIREELGAPPTRELLEWLESRAGTNPLFFSELLKWLVDNSFAQQRYDEWDLVETPEEIEIPRSAESAIEKRLERIDEELYRILEYASVQGDEFDSLVLSRILEMDELELEEGIEPLVREHRLIKHLETLDLPNGDLTDIYQFTHTLFQDVLLKNVRGKRRILLHRKIAEVMAEVYESDTEPIAHKLAFHYDEGRQPGPAYTYAMQAADRASRLFANHDAVGLLERALKNSESDEQKLEVQDRLGEQNQLIGQYGEALKHLEEALGLAEAEGDAVRALNIRRKGLLCERESGATSADEAIGKLGALTEEARLIDAQEELCEILWLRSHPVHGTVGHEEGVAGAVRLAEEALAIAGELGDPRLAARARYELGSVLMWSDEPGQAVEPLEEALKRYSEVGNQDRVARCHNAIGIIHSFEGSYREAAESFGQAASAFDELRHPSHEALVRNNLGSLLIRMGDWEGAEENLQEAVRLFQRLDARAQLLHPLQNLAELKEAEGDLEAAEGYWDRLLKEAQDTGHWIAEIIARCGRGRIQLERGDIEAARAAVDEARALIKREDEWTEGREACCLLGARVAAAEGSVSEAVTLLEHGESALESRDRYLWAIFRLHHGHVLASEERDQGIAMMQEALDTARELGAEPLRKRAEELLTQVGEGS